MADMRPIAVMDSGLGGLSIVRSLRSLAPGEDIYYFADRANFPYGTNSPDLIRRLAMKSAQELVKASSCKMLIVACHTISVWCIEELSEMLDIPVIGMVEPSIIGLRKLLATRDLKSFGIISTKATLVSGAYKRAWPGIDLGNRVSFCEFSCDPLVRLVEEGGLDQEDLLKRTKDLLPKKLRSVDGILLGCTHFSMITRSLRKILKKDCMIVDAAEFVATQALNRLKSDGLLAKKKIPTDVLVRASDSQDHFIFAATRFIKNGLTLNLI